MGNKFVIGGFFVSVLIFALFVAVGASPDAAQAFSWGQFDTSVRQPTRNQVATGVDPLPLFYQWHQSVVDADGDAGAIAFDNLGRIRISYYVSNTIKVDQNNNGQWQVDEVTQTDSGGTIGATTALAVNPQGYNQVAFITYSGFSQSAYYITNNDSGVWSAPILLDPAFSSPVSLAIATDSAGFAHITYCTQNSQTMTNELRYVAVGVSNSVVQSQVADEGCWYSTAVAVDGNGIPHLVYYQQTGAQAGILKYAKRMNQAWVVETIDAVGDAGRFLSLAVTAAGVPHISYSHAPLVNEQNVNEQNEVAIRYAVKEGETWQIQTVATMDKSHFFAGQSAIALDLSGQPQIAFNDGSAQAIMYAWSTANSWQKTVAVNLPNVELGPRALTLDHDGYPHIAFDGFSVGQMYTYATAPAQVYDLFLPVVHQ